MPVWGWGVGAVNEGRESLEGKEPSVQKKISIASEMAGNVPF